MEQRNQLQKKKQYRQAVLTTRGQEQRLMHYLCQETLANTKALQQQMQEDRPLIGYWPLTMAAMHHHRQMMHHHRGMEPHLTHHRRRSETFGQNGDSCLLAAMELAVVAGVAAK